MPRIFHAPWGPVFAAGLAVSALVVGSVFFNGFTITDGGQIAVIRNGGPLDNRQFRQVVSPGSSLTWTGLFSQRHPYPGSQRFYTISADPQKADSGGVDVETVPTSDGVEIGLEATMYFDLNQDPKVLKGFDDKYGTRTYRDKAGEFHPAWDADLGWSTFLDAVIRPVISNDLRQEVGNFRCVDLQASCALVQNNGLKPSQVADVVKGGGTVNNTNIAKIQEAINKSLKEDFESTLGGPYITNVVFRVSKVALPNKLQLAVTDAQASFAQITQAQAKIASATAEAAANSQRQKGYENCPACAQIDLLKAIPPSVTTFAPGTGFAVTAPAK
jgi:regulator of protease activity HflC (stomatin/prohibitin superfamily)